MESRLKTINAITKFIFIEDKPSKADLIIVPGSSHAGLAKKASELYLNGFARKVLFTGGYNPKIRKAESFFGKGTAIKSGLPAKDIFCEDKSTNTRENALATLALLKHLNLKYKKIILVSKPYHARRLLMTFRSVFPKVNFFIVTAKDDRNINKDNWWKNKEKADKVEEEIGKISIYLRRGDLSFK